MYVGVHACVHAYALFPFFVNLGGKGLKSFEKNSSQRKEVALFVDVYIYIYIKI